MNILRILKSISRVRYENRVSNFDTKRRAWAHGNAMKEKKSGNTIQEISGRALFAIENKSLTNISDIEHETKQ